jgi:hypothetical protein
LGLRLTVEGRGCRVRRHTSAGSGTSVISLGDDAAGAVVSASPVSIARDGQHATRFEGVVFKTVKTL